MVNIWKLYKELAAAGLPVCGVSSAGRMDFTRPLSAVEQVLAGQLLNAHVPDDRAEDRQKAYLEQGITPEAMVIALWEHIIENRPQSAQALQTLREQIKQRVSGPV